MMRWKKKLLSFGCYFPRGIPYLVTRHRLFFLSLPSPWESSSDRKIDRYTSIHTHICFIHIHTYVYIMWVYVYIGRYTWESMGSTSICSERRPTVLDPFPSHPFEFFSFFFFFLLPFTFFHSCLILQTFSVLKRLNFYSVCRSLYRRYNYGRILFHDHQNR